MDKFHKVIALFTIMRMFDLTIAGHTDAKKITEARDISTYQINVPGKQPITILEDDGNDKILSPFSDYSNVGQIQFTKRVSNGPTYHSDSIKPIPFSVMPDDDGPKKNSYNPSLLEKFLEKYQTHTHGEDETEAVDMEGTINLEGSDNYERKNYRPQKNSGWVSLDPIPTYSSGKVYKWQSNAQKYRPSRPSYSHNHWNDEDDDDRYYQHRPSPPRPSYHHEENYPETFDDDEGYHVPPKPFGSTYPGSNSYRPHDRPYGNRPTGFSGNKPYYGDDDGDMYRPHKKRPYNDIITDNRAPNFPQYDTHRYGTSSGSYVDKNRKPETYPGHGDGQWVLVSTTKGNGNRKSGSRAISNRKGKSKNRDSGEKSNQGSSISTVLHVLPNPNSRNITTSNGEVIEVAESGRGHRNPFAEPTTRRPTIGTKKQFNKKRLQIIGTAQQPAENSAPAVIAAVGAGLLPASLAIVAPMVLGRRRRDTIPMTETSLIGYKYFNTTDLF